MAAVPPPSDADCARRDSCPAWRSSAARALDSRHAAQPATAGQPSSHCQTPPANELRSPRSLEALALVRLVDALGDVERRLLLRRHREAAHVPVCACEGFLSAASAVVRCSVSAFGACSLSGHIATTSSVDIMLQSVQPSTLQRDKVAVLRRQRASGAAPLGARERSSKCAPPPLPCSCFEAPAPTTMPIAPVGRHARPGAKAREHHLAGKGVSKFENMSAPRHCPRSRANTGS